MVFDVTRQAMGDMWEKKGSNEFKRGKRKKFLAEKFPKGDLPNDDQSDATAEDKDNDESVHPNDQDHMFVIDGPGFDPPDHNLPAEALMRINFMEFVRVAFNSRSPEGNKQAGSRASEKFKWHVRHRAVRAANQPWARANSGNAIGPGNPDIGPPPEDH